MMTTREYGGGHVERRELPRFPVTNEKIKFQWQKLEKVFALRDLSSVGLGIELSDHGESLLFPMGLECSGSLHLGGELFPVDLVVKRLHAASVGFRFGHLTEALRERIAETIDPLHIAHSLRAVPVEGAPEAFRQNIKAWYHGAMNSDLYVWHDSQKAAQRVLLCWNSLFWEWSALDGVRTGKKIPDFDFKQELNYDPAPQHLASYQARKILENASVLDYGLVNFLLAK